MRKKLKWSSQPFEIPKEIFDEWREIGKRGDQFRSKWVEALKKKILKPQVKLIKFLKNLILQVWKS